jgi:uncharacterized membrane protein (UPF0127 family)
MKIKINGVLIEAKECKSFWSKFRGLMFKTKSPPLLFIFGKEKNLSIHSLFCRPFIAIWLNNARKATKIVDVKSIKLNISGKGSYLLEIPESDENYSKMIKYCKNSVGEK